MQDYANEKNIYPKKICMLFFEGNQKNYEGAGAGKARICKIKSGKKENLP